MSSCSLERQDTPPVHGFIPRPGKTEENGRPGGGCGPRRPGTGTRVADMSQGLRMVHLRTVPDAWQARVLAARLGSEGIVTHLQGGVAGPYPFGAVSVLVEAGQADLAADLLLADEVEAAFASQRWAGVGAAGYTDAEAGGDDASPYPTEDLAESPLVAKRWAARRRRALAAVAALLVAGAPVLAHFVGQ